MTHEYTPSPESTIESQRVKVASFLSNEMRLAHRVLSGDSDPETTASFETRHYQEEAWAALWQARHDGADRGLIQLATGLGKTTVAAVDYAAFRTERTHSSRALFVVHQNNILDQAIMRFSDLLPQSSSIRYSATQNTIPNSELTFTTFQTLRESKGKFPPNYFDYIVYDEAHHIEADTYKQVVDYFQPQFQLGITATPNRMDGRDITRHFGEPLYSRSLVEAIQDGELAKIDYRIMIDDSVKRALTDGFQPRNIAELRGLLSNQSRNEEVTDKIKQMQTEIKETENLSSVKTIVFCEDVETTEEFGRILGGRSYHSNLSNSEQLGGFRDFTQGDLETITVRDMFNEGVDVPDARLIVFLRSTKSKVIFEQQLGRGVRKSNTKGTITVMDFVASIDRLIMLQEFSETIFRNDHNDLDQLDKEEFASFSDMTNRFIFDEQVIDILQSYNQLLEKSGYHFWEKYSDADIIELALTIHPDRPMTAREINNQERWTFPSTRTIYARFGSLGNFYRACGFEAINWSKATNEMIVEQALRLSPDQPLLVEDIQLMDKWIFPSKNTIKSKFGSMREFKIACGFNTIAWSQFSNDELVELALQLSPNEPMTSTAFQEAGREEFPSEHTIARRFGSIVAFHKACGFAKSPKWSKYDDQDFIDLARSISPNKPLTGGVIKNLDRTQFPDAGYIHQRFGSLTEFQRACGFAVQPTWSKYTDEEIIELAKQLNPEGPIAKKDIDETSIMDFPGYREIIRRFKTLADFHNACGFKTTPQWATYSDDDLIAIAKELSPNRPLSLKDAKEIDIRIFPSSTYIYKRFGSWTAFQELCGFIIS